MAGALMSSSGGNRRGRRGGYRPVADINVTPLVDVMLVLLIVFMVTAPLLTVSVPVDLPKTKASQSSPAKQEEEPLIISLNSKGNIYIQETQTSPHNLVKKLKALTKANADARVFVRGDKNISYGKVMEIMGIINAAGYRKVALVTELPDSEEK
ncbi:MAG: protein TolR [Bdellovibrionales bacterium]